MILKPAILAASLVLATQPVHAHGWGGHGWGGGWGGWGYGLPFFPVPVPVPAPYYPPPHYGPQPHYGAPPVYKDHNDDPYDPCWEGGPGCPKTGHGPVTPPTGPVHSGMPVTPPGDAQWHYVPGNPSFPGEVQ